MDTEMGANKRRRKQETLKSVKVISIKDGGHEKKRMKCAGLKQKKAAICYAIPARRCSSVI